MREKLIELLRGFFESVYPEFVYESLVDHLIANGVTIQKWIPASEPPKEHGEYIVVIKGAKLATTLWYHPIRGTWESPGSLAPYPVTHWMYTPKTPKGGDNHE